MKNVLATLAVTLVFMGLNTADAADPISDSLMADMGIAGMTTLADHDGDAIRGSGKSGGGKGGGGGRFPTIVFSAEQFTTLNLRFRQSTTVFIQQNTALDLNFAQGTRVNFALIP